MRNFISQGIAIELYTGLIDPHFILSGITYDCRSKHLKHSLQNHENMTVHAVMNVDHFYPSVALHDTLNCDWLDFVWKRNNRTMVYKGINQIR